MLQYPQVFEQNSARELKGTYYALLSEAANISWGLNQMLWWEMSNCTKLLKQKVTAAGQLTDTAESVWWEQFSAK